MLDYRLELVATLACSCRPTLETLNLEMRVIIIIIIIIIIRDLYNDTVNTRPTQSVLTCV